MEALDELAATLRARLVERARAGEAGGALDEEVRALVEREARPLPEAERAELARRVLLLATGLGPLEPLLADPAVDEVMVKRPARNLGRARRPPGAQRRGVRLRGGAASRD
jgi:pilus assembly protein CpaF